MFRFRRFGTRLLALLLTLLFAALGVTYLFVSRANLSNALTHSEDNLGVGAVIFDETIRQRIDNLSNSARVMASDYAIRQALQEDPATLSSMLESLTRRVQAPVITLLDPEGALRAAAGATLNDKDIAPFRQLIATARDKESAEASSFAHLASGLQVLVVVPIYAPYPEIAAWFGLAFPIDRAFAQKIKDTTRLEVTLVSTDDPAHPHVLVTTLPENAGQFATHAATSFPPIISPSVSLRTRPRISIVDLSGERYVTLAKSEPLVGGNPITVVLQRPLSGELASAQVLENLILLISLAALAVAVVVALWIARGVSQPVLQLAAHTKHVAAGDYTRRLDLHRHDELGQLATAFNDMSVGLAERDRVRDLLDKNVSPEVAAQLMRDGATLGGEEREVTILFSDLRGFTTLSEKLAPRELLTLLNRYLDRMSAEIERQGGVIDKFIGDAIMALFGAPVAQSDAADRALAAALAMERALAELNAELAAEDRAPLALGIGVNTARVIAGNMGSQRRLNYSVIGDGVNIAARLQALTRTAEYCTNIITSAPTLSALRDAKTFAARPLGTVQVKGRAQPVEIFAVSQT